MVKYMTAAPQFHFQCNMEWKKAHLSSDHYCSDVFMFTGNQIYVILITFLLLTFLQLHHSCRLLPISLPITALFLLKLHYHACDNNVPAYAGVFCQLSVLARSRSCAQGWSCRLHLPGKNKDVSLDCTENNQTEAH